MSSTTRSAARDALGPALVAAALAVVTALALRYFFAIPTPGELYAEQATTRIPLPLFEALLTTFGSAAKHLYLIAGFIAEAALTALAGVLYAGGREVALRGRVTGELSWVDIPAIAVTLWLLAAGLLAPLLGGGWFGVELVGGAQATLFSQLAPDLVFACAFVWQSRAAFRSRAVASAQDGVARRTLVRQSIIAALTLGGGIAVWQALTSGLGALVGTTPARTSAPTLSLSNIPDRISPPPTPVYSAFAPVAGQSAEVTSATDFYVVSKNLAGDPMINASGWSLAVSGMVETPYRLSYDQLRALPQVTQYHTLECISNDVGGNLISNGFFTGVRLADTLNAAHIQPGASQMVFKAADGYSDSLHLSQALDERSLIVYLLDGQPLPPAHGFPARLLVPGLYGMKNGKWLTELSVVSEPYDGYWEQRGWSREAVVKLTSRIDTPHDGDLLVVKPTAVAGVAYGGDRGIARVDVSVDGGRSWAPATLRRPLGALAWTLWEHIWTPQSGANLLVVRAIDLQGNVQTPTPAPTLPDGAAGYHAITVTAR